MSSAIYGGEEVGALVFDIGQSTIRCGYAGEDLPKADIPSYVGWLDNKMAKPIVENPVTEGLEDNDLYIPPPKQQRRHLCGDDELNRVSENVTLRPLQDSRSSLYNFEVLEELLSYLYTRRLNIDPKMHPALFSEPFDNSPKNREKLSELLFEKFECPAISACKSPSLTAFCHGRTNALVVDLGHSRSTVCPVNDGYCLTKACYSGPVNGSMLLDYTHNILTTKHNIVVTPTPLIQTRQLRNIGEMPMFTVREVSNRIDYLWVSYHKRQLLRDFMSRVFVVSEFSSSISAYHPKIRSGVTEYQFPSGYRLNLLQKFPEESDLFRIPELYFDQELQNRFGINNGTTLQKLVNESASCCDVDIKINLLGNVILTGGCSAFPGMSERLYNELVASVSPTLKVKLIASNTLFERKYSAWIGGSILASLGSFQQLWISKNQYAERGVSCLSSHLVS